MRKTRLTAHTAPSALALPVSACGSRWKAHSLKSWPLKGMHLGLKCQLGSARTAGQFLYCWLFAMVKPRPFPAPWGWFIELMKFQALAQSDCIGFLSQYKDFTNCISSLPLWLPPPHLKTMSYPEPVALDVQVSLCSGPWGQPSHIHFSLPFKIPVWACTSLACSRLGQIVGGPRMSSSPCLTAQLTSHLAELSLAELNLSS